jgi:hypothetical protein
MDGVDLTRGGGARVILDAEVIRARAEPETNLPQKEAFP